MIEVEDATVFLRMHEGEFDAIITSPPYADLRCDDYPTIPEDEYGSWTATWADAALDAVKPTGSLLLNLGRKWNGGVCSTYQYTALGACLAVGWELVDEIAWVKPNANPIGGRFLTNAWEIVWQLARDPSKVYDGSDALRRPYAEGTAARYGRGWENHTSVKGSSSGRGRTLNPLGARAQNVLVHTTGREKGNPHPCPMPLDLAVDLVQLAAPAGGLVADPFAGSGTTLLAALQTNRRAIGCDLDPASVTMATARLQKAAA